MQRSAETALGMDAFASDIGVSRAQRIINAILARIDGGAA